MKFPLSDDELMSQIQAGKTAAFEALYDRHLPSVLGYCLRILGGNRSLAEDVVQEVWVSVARDAPKYEARGTFKAWLMTVTRHQAWTQAKKQLRVENDPVTIEEEPDEGVDIEGELLLRQDRRFVHNAIEALPDTQRLALMLSVVDELSYEEIAVKIQSTVPAVRSLVFRARQELRNKLKKYER